MDRDEARRERYEREYRDCYQRGWETMDAFVARIREARKKAQTFGMIETDYEAALHLKDRVYTYYQGVARRTLRYCTIYDIAEGPQVDLKTYELELQDEAERRDTKVEEMMAMEAEGERFSFRATESEIRIQRLEARLGEEHVTHEIYTTRAQEAFQRANAIRAYLQSEEDSDVGSGNSVVAASPEYTLNPHHCDDQFLTFAGVGTGHDEAGPSELPRDDIGHAAKRPRFEHFDEGGGEV